MAMPRLDYATDAVPDTGEESLILRYKQPFPVSKNVSSPTRRHVKDEYVDLSGSRAAGSPRDHRSPDDRQTKARPCYISTADLDPSRRTGIDSPRSPEEKLASIQQAHNKLDVVPSSPRKVPLNSSLRTVDSIRMREDATRAGVRTADRSIAHLQDGTHGYMADFRRMKRASPDRKVYSSAQAEASLASDLPGSDQRYPVTVEVQQAASRFLGSSKRIVSPDMEYAKPQQKKHGICYDGSGDLLPSPRRSHRSFEQSHQIDSLRQGPQRNGPPPAGMAGKGIRSGKKPGPQYEREGLHEVLFHQSTPTNQHVMTGRGHKPGQMLVGQANPQTREMLQQDKRFQQMCDQVKRPNNMAKIFKARGESSLNLIATFGNEEMMNFY